MIFKNLTIKIINNLDNTDQFWQKFTLFYFKAQIHKGFLSIILCFDLCIVQKRELCSPKWLSPSWLCSGKYRYYFFILCSVIVPRPSSWIECSSSPSHFISSFTGCQYNRDPNVLCLVFPLDDSLKIASQGFIWVQEPSTVVFKFIYSKPLLHP